MRKRYLAMAMSFVLACTQLSGAVSVAHAADLIVEESYVEDVHAEDVPVEEMHVNEAENLMTAEAEPEVFAEEVEEVESLADLEELPGEYVSVDAEEEFVDEENEGAEDAAAENELADAEEAEAGEGGEEQDVVSEEAAELNLEEEFITFIEEVDVVPVEVMAEGEDEQENGEVSGDEEQGPQIFITPADTCLRDEENNFTWLFEGETQTYYVDYSQLEGGEYDVEWTVFSEYDGIHVEDYVTYSENETDNTFTMTALEATPEGDTVRVAAVVKNEAGEEVETGIAVDVRRERVEPEWPGNLTLLPHETWDFSKWIRCYVENPKHPRGEWINIEILNVNTELQNGAEGAVVCNPWEDGNGWQIKVHDYGHLEIILCYVPVDADKESAEFIPEEYPFNIWAGGERWEMGIDSNSNNNLMLPGSSYMLTANIARRCYDEKQGQYDGDVSLTEVVWSKDENLQVTLSQTGPVRPDEDGNVFCTITANADAESGNGGHIYAKTYLIDEEGNRVKDVDTEEEIELASERYYVEIHNGYYVLKRDWDHWLDVGASITEYTPQLLYYDVNKDEPESVEADKFYWYGDSSIVEIKDANGDILNLNGEEGASGEAPFTITKLENKHTDIKVAAVAKEGTEQEIREEQSYWLGGIDYSTWVNEPTRENGWTWLYTDEELNLTLDTRNITKNDGNLKDGLEIKWLIGQYDEDGNFTPLEQSFYAMESDKTSVTLDGNVLTSAYEAGTKFDVGVQAYMNKILVSEEQWAWIELREPRYELNTNFGEYLEAFPNNTYRLERWANAWFEDVEFCYEGKAQAYITDIIEITPHEGCEDGLVYEEDEDENNFWLRTTDNHGGVTVKVQYEIRTEKEDEEGNRYNPYNDQIFEDTFDIGIGGDRYEMGISSSTGKTQMLPGAELDLFADLEYIWWDEHEECDKRDPEVEETQKDVLKIEWGTNQEGYENILTFIQDGEDSYTCHVTAKTNINEHGESVRIWVRASVLNEEDEKYYERAYDERDIWVGSEYYVIDTDPDIDRDQKLGVYDSVVINPTVIRRYLGENGEEQEESLTADEVIWRWEDWDPNALKIEGYPMQEDTDGQEASDGTDGSENQASELTPENNRAMGPFTLTKLKNNHSSICLRAYSAENPEQDLTDEWWNFHEVDYSVEFQELRGGDHTWVYTDEDLNVDLNTENLKNKGCTLEWTLGHFEEDDCIESMTPSQSTEDEAGQYVITESGIILKGEAIEQWLAETDPERNDFDIRVKVMKNGTELWQAGTGAHIRTSYYELRGNHMNGIEAFPQQGYWINRNQACVLEDAIHPEEIEVGARITDLQVVPDEDSKGCAAIVYYDENGYEIRTTNYGHAKVYVTYTISDEENEEDNHYKDFAPFTQEFDIWIGGDRYELEVSSDTGRDQLLPNASLNLNADVKYFYWDEENREEIMDENPEVKDTVSIKWGYEHPDSAEVVTLTENADNPYTITVTANDITEDRNAWIYAKVQVWDEHDQVWYDRAYLGYKIWVNQGYVLIEADADRWNELEPGDSIVINPSAWLYENGETERDVTGEIIWRWEDWDPNALKIEGYPMSEDTDGQEASDGTEGSESQVPKQEMIELSPENNSAMGPFTLTKLSTNRTDIRLNSYWANNGDYAGEEWWTFDSPNCDTHFEEMRGGDNWTWVFSDETEYVIRLNQENLGNKDDYIVDWELGHFDEVGNLEISLPENIYDETTDSLQGGAYKVDAENDCVILDGAAVKEWFRSNIDSNAEETPWISVRAIISYEVNGKKEEMSRCDANVDIWEPEENYSFMNDYPGDTRLMPGEGIWFNQNANCWVRNSSIPHGEDKLIRIIDVVVEMKKGSPAMAAECSWIDNEGDEDDGWNIYVHNPCEATVTVTYLPWDAESEEDTVTYSFDLYGAEGMHNVSVESSLNAAQLQPGQSADLKAVVSHATLDKYYEDSEEGLLEGITVEWSAEPEEVEGTETVTLEFDTTGVDGGRNCKVTAGDYAGRVKIIASVYYTEEDGTRREYPETETEYEIEINQYQIEDHKDHVTMQEQYLLPGQGLDIFPVLMNGENQHTGKIHYRLEYDRKYIAVSQEELFVEIPAEESGEDNTDAPDTGSEGETEESQEYTGPYFWVEKTQEGWTGVTLVAETWNEEKRCYQEVARRDWYFNDVHMDLWFDHVRGDEYTWIYDDETYELWAHGGQGLQEAGRYVEWEVGYFGEDGPLHLCETEENTSEVPYILSDKYIPMITINGKYMQDWIDSVPEDIKEQGGLVIIARVVQEWYNGDGNVEKEYVAERTMGFEVREAYEYWEDEDITEILPGDFFSYVNGTLTRYVENKKYPHGEELAYTITGITSTNEDVYKVEEPVEESTEWIIRAVNPGMAEITYTLEDEAGDTIEKTFTKYVADTVYYLDVRRDTNTNQMFPGQKQVLQPVVVKVAATVNEDEKLYYTRTTLTTDQYTVEYINHNPDQITVSKDGHVTAEDYGEAWVDLKVVVKLEDGDTHELYTGMDFYIIDRPYVAFSGEEWYAVGLENTITYTPELVQVDEQGNTTPYYGTGGIEFELEEHWSDVLSIEPGEDNTWIISPKDTTETTATTVRVIARGTDEYGYPLEMDFWFDVSFCEHEYNDDNWVVFAWPGCETTGKRIQECIHCGLCCGEKEILTATGHAWGGWTIDQEATCTEEGAQTHSCDTCEKIETETIPSAGHTEVTDAAKEATCEATGLTEGKRCSVCKKVLVAQSAIAALGHTEVKDAAVTATCEGTGLTEGKHCSVCKKVLVVQSVVSAFGHKSDAGTVTKAATCIAAGTKTFKCTVCGKKLKDDPIPKLAGTVTPAASKLNIQLKKSVLASKLVSGLMEGDYIANVTTSNASLVTVKQSGSDWKITGKKVTSKKTGTAAITITLASGASAKIAFSVQKAAVKTATLKVTNAAKKLNLTVGDNLTLETLVKPITTSDKLTFTTSNKKIVAVSKAGVLTAKKAGTATITVKSGKKSVKIKVTVKKLAPSSFTLNKTVLNLKVKKSATLKVKFAPSGSEGKVTFKSSNTKIAAVNKTTGKVTAKKKGTVTITATVKSATGETLTQTCTVTVK